MAKVNDKFELSCPFPFTDYPSITIGHGGGGKLTSQLIEKIFRVFFANRYLDAGHDGAVLEIEGLKLAFTTDSFVVNPLFFPGGDIGSLSVIGTCNDLAMCGARPLYLSCGMILEEGLGTETLSRITCSMKKAAGEVAVQIVTGDTKVVDRGKGDSVFINTSGIGLIEHGRMVGPAAIKPGDAIILSGDVGRHGVAVLAQREGLQFETSLVSDVAHLTPAVLSLFAAGLEVHCLRDLTRGGLATSLVELAEAAGADLVVEESRIAVSEPVQGACEMLGLDPFYVANEGRFVVLLPQSQAEKALSLLKAKEVSAEAAIIGAVSSSASGRGRAVLKTPYGVERLLDRLSGEQLPRIC